MKEFKFDGVIDENDPTIIKLLPENFVKRVLWDKKGKQVKIKLSESKAAKRTLDQNALLFGIIYKQIIQFHKDNTGETLTPWQVHLFCMTHEEICGNEIIPIKVMGKTLYDIERTKSSSKNIGEFSERIINPIIKFFTVKGLDFKLPDDPELKFKNYV